MTLQEVIETIVELEWAMVGQAQNTVNKTDNSPEWQEFRIMRSAQFKAWSEELIRSYLLDIDESMREGRNLLTEKYVYMMETTNPAQFLAASRGLPVITPEMRDIIDEITDIQTKWSVDFAREYPYVAGKGHAIHPDEDPHYAESVRTYTQGEMKTYSLETLQLYLKHMKDLLADGKNMVYETRNYTVQCMGYKDVAQAEQTMAERFG